MIKVNIFNDTARKRLPRKCITEVTENVLHSNKIVDAALNIIYVDDDTILDINSKFLKHNFVTDVITFDLEAKDKLLAEIYISVDTAERQAKDYSVSLKSELKRLAIHGALHLVGYNDGTADEKVEMTKMENKFLGFDNV